MDASGRFPTDPLPIVGVELGGRMEKTALCVVERTYIPTGETFTAVGQRSFGRRHVPRLEAREKVRAEYHVRHLERHGPPSRYKKIAARTAELAEAVGSRAKIFGPCALVVDVTATGRPVYSLIRDVLEEALRVSSTEARSEGLKDVRVRITPCPVTVTGIAGGVSRSPDAGWLVPRRDLISAAQILFDGGRLKIAESLELAETLRDELLSFKAKPDKPSDLEGWRERPHDDLVLAVALSVWAAERFLRKKDSVPAGGSSAGIPRAAV